MNAGTLTPKVIFDAVKRRDRRRWWLSAGLVVITLLFTTRITIVVNDNRRRHSSAQSAAITILNAIDQFHTDYDFLPMPTSHSRPRGARGASTAEKRNDWHTDTSAEENLIALLKGEDLTASLRNTDHLGRFKDAKTVDGQPVDGLVRDGETIAIVDPWGRPYLVRLDGNGDGYVEDPSHPGTMLHKTAIVWSAGKDGDPAAWEDNVKSWDIAR